MSKTASAFLNFPVRLWARVSQFLTEQAEREVNNWGAAMQYKRRYTNPDTAKRYRQVI
jgi:hypothetical protein